MTSSPDLPATALDGAVPPVEALPPPPVPPNVTLPPYARAPASPKLLPPRLLLNCVLPPLAPALVALLVCPPLLADLPPAFTAVLPDVGREPPLGVPLSPPRLEALLLGAPPRTEAVPSAVAPPDSEGPRPPIASDVPLEAPP